MKFALAGNPNSGKTTLFNALTGSSQYVGNWPGVTVEKKEGKLKGHKDIVIVDLPGIYSLSPYTLEEVVSRNFLMNEKPELIINVVDATNIERNLYLTTQLIETGVPVVVALNMMDIIRSRKEEINTSELSKRLGCPVVEMSALKSDGLDSLINEAISLSKKDGVVSLPKLYTGHLFDAIKEVKEAIKDIYSVNSLDWYAVKFLEADSEVMKNETISDSLQATLDQLRSSIEEAYDDDVESVITNARYEFITNMQEHVYKKGKFSEHTISDKIDLILTNRWLALPIFAIVMFFVYSIAMSSVGAMATDWVNDVFVEKILKGSATGLLEGMNTAPWLISLVVEGVIGGVGAVIGFVPQIMILFFLLSILEDCGYMSRIAFIMDRVFRKFGLSGKSFIPMLISTGCAVPGIMASRTIEEEKDRKMTIMLTSFMPCSAKLPIFALFGGAVFGGNSWVSTSIYFVGIASVIVCGIFLKKTKYFGGDPAPFVMELPAYHWPSIKGLLIHMWDRAKSFIKKAGTIILLASIVIWFLSNFSFSLEMVDMEESILASIGRVIAPIFAPLGWGNWQSTVATISGLVAKEVIVSTFGLLFGVAEVAEDGVEVWSQVAQIFTPLSAYSFMVFNLLCAPCFAAIGAIRREMGSGKWTLLTVAFQCGFAYIVALLIFQIGILFF